MLLREKILLTISTWGIKAVLRIAILGSGPIPNLLAQELNSTEEVELFTSQNVTIDGIKVSDYRSLLNRALDFDVVVIALRGLPKTGTEKAVVLRHVVGKASPETLIINMSSVSVYGQNSDVNFETTVPHPINPYGYSKYYLERYLNIFASSKVCNLRISNVFGCIEFNDVVNTILNAAASQKTIELVSPETVYRDFISIDTVTRIITQLMSERNKLSVRELMNVSSGKSINLLQIMNVIENCLNRKISYTENISSSNMIQSSYVSNKKTLSYIDVSWTTELEKIKKYLSRQF
jgi:UDP-glucose 4-epimerase